MSVAPFAPDVAALIERMRSAGRPSFEMLDVAAARAIYRAGRDTLQLAPLPVAGTEDLSLGDRPARRYRPSDAGAGTILFLHGGGYVIGDLDTHDGICRHLAVAAGLDVVAVDYRLAPEHPFPAAFDDALAAYRRLAGHGPVALAGDSAGGTLALAVALAAEPVAAAALALFYPVADVSKEWPSYGEVGAVPIGAETMRWFWAHAFGDADRSDWRASPLLAEDLSHLPPTFLTTAGHDPLRDEGLRLADRLRGAGILVEHRHLPGHVHGYLTQGRVLAEAERSLAAAGLFLRTCLDGA